MKKLIMFAAFLSCAMTIWAQGPIKKSKMSPWLLNQYQQQQMAVKQNGGPLRVKGRPVRNYILTLVESTDEAAAIRQKGGVVFHDFGDGICAAFLPTDSLGALDECPSILCMEANAPAQAQNDTSAVITGVSKAWDFENNLPSDLKPQTSSIPQAFTGKGVIAGVMDIGFDFTHPAFRNDDGTSRIQWFWDPLAKNSDPDAYGTVYDTPEKVLAAQCSSDAVTNKPHGTHVMGSMAGNGLNGRYVGMAPEADIIGAHILLSPETTAENLTPLVNYIKEHIEEYPSMGDVVVQSALASALQLVELHELFKVADAAGKPCVVNWSFGMSHSFTDDYTLYEKVLNKMLGPGRVLLIGAGNSGHLMTYLHKAASEPLQHDFFCSCDSTKESYAYELDIRKTGGADFKMTVTIEDVEEPFVIDTREIEFIDHGNLKISVNEHSDFIIGLTQIDYAGGFAGYQVLFYPKQNVFPHPKKLKGSILIDTPVELDFIFPYKIDYNMTFSPYTYADSRGCNQGTIGYPASLERAITVGAMHHRTSFTNILGQTATYRKMGSKEGQLVAFSSCGPGASGLTKPDVVAPGHNIISALNSFYLKDGDAEETKIHEDTLTAYKANVFGKDYAMWSMSGTSMACPIAAGIVALWLQAKPDLTPEDILGVIARTSHQPEPEFSGYEKNNYYGYGEIDAYAGLLDILQLTDIPEISHHQPAGLTFRVEGRTLYIDGLDGEAPITLFDLSGRPVLQTVTSGTLQLPHLAAGVYAVQLGQLGSTLIRLS